MHQLCREFVPAKRIAAGLIQIGQPLVLKQQKQESLTCFIRFYLTVDFFYRPTYLATAVVIKAYMTASELLNEGSDHLIFRGMLLGSTGRGFKGHGYDDLKGLLDTLDLFTEAGAAEFVRYHPYYCIEFKKLFRESVSMIEKRLAKGALCNEWGEDFTEEAQRVISRL